MGTGFQARQAEFTAYIRDPENNPPPADVKPKRMAVYRELFFNNIDSFLSSNFPVLRTLLSDEQWQALARDFYARHRCETPYFSEIAEEFLDYLQNERREAGDFPFLLELAHYEWVEMALSIAKSAPVYGDQDFVADIANRAIALSPLAWPLIYRYPVERISPDFIPEATPEQPTYLIVYRDTDDSVHFLQSTAYTFRLLQLIEQNPGIASAAALQTLATETHQLDRQTVFQFGLQTLQELAAKGIVIPADAA